MDSREHYRRAMAILNKVEAAEVEAENLGNMPLKALQAWNDNIQRKLKIAEIHMLGAQFLKVV
jgi:chemotaxis regulatin CheY-phosphate phosphatase CheZ